MFDLFRSRDRAVRILLGVILGAVALSMVAYLIPQGNIGGGPVANDDNVIARVGNDKVTVQAAALAIDAQTKGKNLPPEIRSFFAPQVVQQLINERALALEAERMGFTATTQEAAEFLKKQIPADFYDKDGHIKQAELDAALARNNTTIEQVLEDNRRGMEVSRLRQVVMDSVIVTKGDVEREFKRKGEKVKIEYVLIKQAMVDQQVQVSPADVESYFNKNRMSYQTSEKKNLAILVLDEARVEQSITPTDSELQSAYASNSDRYRSPERVKVRHILLTTDAAKNDDAQVKVKAAALLKQLQGGADFADLARKNSQDPGSGAKGGELDFVTRGQTVKPFEDAAFSLKPGELSGLVKTQYGYHILQVESKEDAHLKPFAEVKDTLTGEFKKRRATEEIQKLADRARAELKSDPSHPEKAAADVHADLIRKDDLKAGDPIPEVGVSPDLQNALATLKKGDISQPIALQNSKLVLVDVMNVLPAHAASLNEVRPQVESTVRNQRLLDLVQKRINDLAAKTREYGNDLDRAAKEMGLEVKTPAEFDRQGAVEGFGSAGIVVDAFTAKDGAVIGPLNAADGKGIIKVLSHTPADLAGFGAQQASMRDELKNKIGRERLSLFEDGVRKALEKDGKVKIQNDVLNRFVQGMKG